MPKRESTDAAGVEATAEKTEKASSMDPFPEGDRDTDRTTTSDEPTTSDQTTDDNETGTARQSDESTGRGDDRYHACDPDSPVPCRFQ